MKTPLILPISKEEAEKIRDAVVTWYEKQYKDREIEVFDYELSKSEDRLKALIFGIFF